MQVVTGVILWTAYSPSAQTAWESVYYIQHQMTGGWLLRGVHHFMAQAMVVLLAVHFVQVVIDGAYRAPREINFWLGLMLMQIVLGLALTGYLLPWDQKGYWATKVATNMMALVPVVGASLQKLVVGGSEYGHHTLTRFFALHAGVLPGLLIVFSRCTSPCSAATASRSASRTAAGHHVLARPVAARRGCLPGGDDRRAGARASKLSEPKRRTAAGQQLGRRAAAPADPAENYSAARPEMYFLFLFQLLKYLEAFPPIVGAIVVPGLVMLSLFLMPFIGRWELGHRFNVVWTFALLDWRRRADGDRVARRPQRQDASIAALSGGRGRCRSARQSGPSSWPVRRPAFRRPAHSRCCAAIRRLQGPKLFRQHCASCHSHASAEAVNGRSVASDRRREADRVEPVGLRHARLGARHPRSQADRRPALLRQHVAQGRRHGRFGERHVRHEALDELKDEELAAAARKIEDVAFALADEAGLIRGEM